MYFCSEKRDEMRAQNPQWNTNEVNRALVNMWNRMSEEEKRHFEMSAFDDKDRIRRELEKVKQTCARSERFME
ncbi:uncharacterized protein [Blastocystis hominis]|uniref:HMG box domain-containing protein n=1 Tax=Blastocystis hominis TaxID=12968 RepID=D8LYM6_BLAHO|nr:uncharacterized protein [Blastocystis hominis]CBK20681.2 unnamed protein product [Blastocystis hominis]|eukprot:XP_012894729.1 uncharacterized protein [Blastocystis hominis]